MKFSNGCWLQKEGCSCFAPAEAYFTKIEEKKVTICAPTAHIVTRGDTLGGINLTLEITSPAPEILRVRTYHYKGEVVNTPSFELELNEELPLDVTDSEDEISIKSGELTLVITKKNWSMTYYRNGEMITRSAGRDLALMKTDFKGFAYNDTDAEETYMRQMLSLSVGELVYGTGERFTPFVKNGQSIDIWNADGGTSTEQSYKNIPFFITNKGYGVLVNHPEKVSIEVATEMVTRTEFSVPGGYLDYFLINGPTMKEVLTRYTDLTGKPSLPAPWTFGLWLSTSFTTNYDEATVMSFIDGMLDRGIPLRTFHFDCFWMKEFHWSDFVWDNRVFPDPAGLLKRIKAKGLNICVWINSYIGQESVLFNEGMEKGYFIKRTNGQVWQWDMWQPGMAIVDFTNPEAYKWFQSKLEVLLDMGVDCFKTDFGERIPSEGVVYHDGSDPKKMHNYYTYLYNKCVYELLERKRGKGQAVLFARSATVGGQKFPVHWGGDCSAEYTSMAETLRGGLSLCSSGFGFFSHDIGGFEAKASPDVYKRWCAFGLMSTHSRLHGSTSYRVPWNFDEESCDVLRFFTKLKGKLMPYLFAQAVKTHTTGIPMMRPMVMDYTDDIACRYLDQQYMLGDNLLCAPVFREDGVANFYLPEGKWYDIITGKTYEGGKYHSVTCTFMEMPVLAKPNSIVTFGAFENQFEYDYLDGADAMICSLEDGKTAEAAIYDTKANLVLTLKASRKGNVISIESSNTDKTFTVSVAGTDKKITMQGGKGEIVL